MKATKKVIELTPAKWVCCCGAPCPNCCTCDQIQKP